MNHFLKIISVFILLASMPAFADHVRITLECEDLLLQKQAMTLLRAPHVDGFVGTQTEILSVEFTTGEVLKGRFFSVDYKTPSGVTIGHEYALSDNFDPLNLPFYRQFGYRFSRAKVNDWMQMSVSFRTPDAAALNAVSKALVRVNPGLEVAWEFVEKIGIATPAEFSEGLSQGKIMMMGYAEEAYREFSSKKLKMYEEGFEDGLLFYHDRHVHAPAWLLMDSMTAAPVMQRHKIFNALKQIALQTGNAGFQRLISQAISNEVKLVDFASAWMRSLKAKSDFSDALVKAQSNPEFLLIDDRLNDKSESFYSEEQVLLAQMFLLTRGAHSALSINTEGKLVFSYFGKNSELDRHYTVKSTVIDGYLTLAQRNQVQALAEQAKNQHEPTLDEVIRSLEKMKSRLASQAVIAFQTQR